MVRNRQVVASLVLLCAVLPGTRAYAGSVSDPVTAALNVVPTQATNFVGIAPCRLADTRGNGFSGVFGPPSLVGQPPGGTFRFFPVAGHCGIPLTAQAVSANMAVTNTTGTGFISVWPGGDPQPAPLVASINYSAGQTIANAVLAPLGTSLTGASGINVFARVGLDLIIDVNGYFEADVVDPTHEVGRQGEPVFTNNGFCIWSNFDGGAHSTAAFYKDSWGTVHLKGLVRATDFLPPFVMCDVSTNDALIFTLPADYAPKARSVFMVLTNEFVGRINVDLDGKVSVDGGSPNIGSNMKVWLSLDGISFRHGIPDN